MMSEPRLRLMRRNLSLAQRSLIAALIMSFTDFAIADNRGVVDGPDECANVRAEKRPDALVVARVKTGEPFTFETKEGDEWCKVTLPSKKVGWMQSSCIRLFFTKKDWPHGTPTEIAPTFGRKYYKVMLRAESGDKEALKQFFGTFGKDLDGAAAENHDAVVLRVVHILGDAKLADFLQGASPADRAIVKGSFHASLASDAGVPVESVEYIWRHFLKTWKVLFPREIVKWPSPDGRYAIHKWFSEQGDKGETKVIRAELIEKATGRALVDLTSSDIGKGAWDRDGDVLWAPDSKRFAYVSSDLTPMRTGGLKEQTTVFQLTGQAFGKVDLPLADKPETERDVKVGDATH